MALDRVPDKTKNKLDPYVGARGSKIVFIPWDPQEGEEWARKTAQWNHVTGNKYEIVHYTPGLRSPFLARASTMPDCAIYIRGHGNPGVPYIQVKVDVGNDKTEERKILITEACKRLVESGLQPVFCGAIKFFHCHSATILTQAAYDSEVKRLKSKNATFKEAHSLGSITDKQLEDWMVEIHPNKSIARIGADYMRKAGFKRCTYYGYLGPLASEYDDDGTGTLRKMAELGGLQNRPPALSGLSNSRASRARVQV